MGSQVMAQLCLALKEKQYFESHGCLLLLLFLRMVGEKPQCMQTQMHMHTLINTVSQTLGFNYLWYCPVVTQ